MTLKKLKQVIMKLLKRLKRNKRNKKNKKNNYIFIKNILYTHTNFVCVSMNFKI